MEAALCPTFGCERRFVLWARARARGAELRHLVGCLASLALARGVVHVIAMICKAFEKKKSTLAPPASSLLMECARFSSTVPGHAFWVTVVLVVLVAFVKFRRRPHVRISLVSLTALAIAFVPIAGFLVLLVLVNMPHRL